MTLGSKMDACYPAGSRRVQYMFWGLLPVSDPSAANLIPPGSKVRIETETDFLDGFLRFAGIFLTLGIYAGSQSIDVSICQQPPAAGPTVGVPQSTPQK